MALPTTGLTLHCDASDTGQLFTTFSGGGTHTGTPNDGDAVQVNDDEGDGVSNVAMIYEAVAPNFRSGGSALMKSGLGELDYNGSSHALGTCTQTGSSKGASNFLSASAGTIAIVFYPESVTSTAANFINDHWLIGGRDKTFGMTLRSVSGTPTLLAFNNDGAIDEIDTPVSTGAVWIAVFRHGGGNIKLTVIDSAGNETSPSDVASGDTTSLVDRLTEGHDSATAAYYDGRRGEFAIWNVELTGTDLTDAKDYFKNKWLTLGGGVGGQPIIRRFSDTPFVGGLGVNAGRAA